MEVSLGDVVSQKTRSGSRKRGSLQAGHSGKRRRSDHEDDDEEVQLSTVQECSSHICM